MDYAEQNGLLPVEQFGFRAKRSTFGAVSLLHEIVDGRLKAKKRTYAAFIDLAKAFDKVDRTLLFAKLQNMSIPYKICATLFNIFNNVKIFLNAGDSKSEPFTSNIGGPQGDVSSALLFSLFTSDIVEFLPKLGPIINGVIVSIILYADDMCLLAESAEDLQKMLDALKCYCDENKLEVNIRKTKVMVFHRGRLPKESFTYDGKSLEIVSSFCYLGFTLTVQLSFTQHLQVTISKARARIGLLYAKLPIQDIPLHLVKQVFDTFIAPTFHYGLCLWINKCSIASMQSLDAVWSKYLKRYLGIPPYSNNSIVYHVTDSQPLSTTLKSLAPRRLGGLVFPECFSGMRLSFIQGTDDQNFTSFNPVPSIPTTYWMSRIVTSIPSNKFYRHRLMREVLDIPHYDICTNVNFHYKIDDQCRCKLCDGEAHAYHTRYCEGHM